MMMTVENRLILITGASSGIGRELAVQLSRKQNRLILLARRKDRLDDLLQKIPRSHPQKPHLVYACDVSELQQVKAVCLDLMKNNLIPQVLILNAGSSFTYDINDMDLETFQKTFAVNYWGVVYFIYFLYPLLQNSEKKCIIAATASLAGYRGMPQSAPYSSSKAALINFMESMSIDLFKSNIQVTTISPGFVKSEMTDKNDFYMPFFKSTETAVRIIIKGLEKGKTEIHFPYRLSLLAKLSCLIPRRYYIKLMQNKRQDKPNEI